jgi:hypothetical protein
LTVPHGRGPGHAIGNLEQQVRLPAAPVPQEVFASRWLHPVEIEAGDEIGDDLGEEAAKVRGLAQQVAQGAIDKVADEGFLRFDFAHRSKHIVFRFR